jgi:hypothetical protein
MKHIVDDTSRQRSPQSDRAARADLNCVEREKNISSEAKRTSRMDREAPSNLLSENQSNEKTLRLRRPSARSETVQGNQVGQDQYTRNRSSSKECKARGIEQDSSDFTTQEKAHTQGQALPGVLALLWAWAREVVEASGWAPDHTSFKEARLHERSRDPHLAETRTFVSSKAERLSQTQARTVLGVAFAVVVMAVAKSGYLPVAFFLCAIASPLMFIV